MRCDDLKAFLDGELGILARLRMRMHVSRCATCRQDMAEWPRLSREIEQLEGEPVPPGLRDTLMSDAMTAAASARSHALPPPAELPRAEGVWAMRKAILAAAFAVALLAIGFGLLPRQKGSTVLADMADAMAKVSSVHFTGFVIVGDGTRIPLDGWVKGADRIRISVKGVVDICDNGRQLIAAEWGDLPKVTVRSSGDLPGLAKGMTYLDLFSGTGRLRSAIAANGATVTVRKNVAMPGGRVCRMTELVGDSGARMRIFTDTSTSLLARSETYDGSGNLVEAIEAVAYNVPVSDSLFRMSIPEDLPVLDMESPKETESALSRKADFKRLLLDPNAKFLLSVEHTGRGYRGTCATDIHPGVQFEVHGPGLVAVFYLADKNVYHIVGRGQAFDDQQGWRSEIVEDGDIRVPGEPQVEDVLMLNGKPGEYCGRGRAGAYRFVNSGPGLTTVTYHKVKEAFVIRGTVKALPTGKTYTNEVALPAAQPYGSDGVRRSTEYNRDIIAMVRRGDRLDWGRLPENEIASMKADVETALRLAQLDESRSPGGRVVFDGAQVTALYGGGSSPHGVFIDPAGPGTQVEILEVPSRKELHVIGRAWVKVTDKPGRIVKNGVVDYDGNVLSSEE